MCVRTGGVGFVMVLKAGCGGASLSSKRCEVRERTRSSRPSLSYTVRAAWVTRDPVSNNPLSINSNSCRICVYLTEGSLWISESSALLSMLFIYGTHT